MSRVLLPVGVVVALLGAGYVAYTYFPRPVPEAVPEVPAPPGLDPADRDALVRATDPELFRAALNSATSPDVRAEVETLFAARAAEVATALVREIDDLRASRRYVDAVRTAERCGNAWTGTAVAERAQQLVVEVRAEEEAQVSRRVEEALALLDEGRFDGAREALETGWQLEAPYLAELTEKAVVLERLIRVREHEASKSQPGGPVVIRPPLRAPPGAPPAPPPLPGAPHPDVKRLAEARILLASARLAFDQRRYQPAAKSLDDLTGFYGDLRFVTRRKEAIAALGALARHGASGLVGLFHAAEARRDGSRLKLRYTFAKEEELLDWEAFQPLPRPGGGSFTRIADGVRGEGLMSFLLLAFFEHDVSVRCIARPRFLKSHGLIFSQEGTETRFLLWMVANTFLVEGENYVKERPGHAILMFGKGVNNDVPLDSPEMGFIFRGDSITKPELVAGEEALLGFAARDKEMIGEVVFKGDRGGRSGSALGDDGKGVERLRPGLVVLDNTVVFRDVLVEGKLHPDFERARVSALLDLTRGLDEE